MLKDSISLIRVLIFDTSTFTFTRTRTRICSATCELNTSCPLKIELSLCFLIFILTKNSYGINF